MAGKRREITAQCTTGPTNTRRSIHWDFGEIKVLGLLVEQKVISLLCDYQLSKHVLPHASLANIFLCYCALTLCLVF